MERSIFTQEAEQKRNKKRYTNAAETVEAAFNIAAAKAAKLAKTVKPGR
ncbi:hypothetical protein [Neisseria meningitidis]|nr:hypothetical protein [Neisseria meningitidis]